MTDRYEDDRGVIQDLLGQVDSVTEISTKAGAVRGNHVHQKTTQYTYVVSGALQMAQLRDGKLEAQLVTSGQLVEESPGIPHAWRAVTDCTVLVFTIGPRSGENYESDTVRLAEGERLL